MNIKFIYNKPIRVVLILICLYLSYIFSVSFITRYTIVGFDYGKYLWLFSNEYKNKVDTIYNIGLVRSNSTYYKYRCDNFDISIFEIPSLNSTNLDDIELKLDSDLSEVEFYPAKVLNSKLEVFPTIRVWARFPFNNKLAVYFDESSDIIQEFAGSKYKAYFANIHKMSFANEKGKHIMLFDYKGNRQKSMLIFKQENHGLYIIILNSEDEITSDVLRVFNLD